MKHNICRYTTILGLVLFAMASEAATLVCKSNLSDPQRPSYDLISFTMDYNPAVPAASYPVNLKWTYDINQPDLIKFNRISSEKRWLSNATGSPTRKAVLSLQGKNISIYAPVSEYTLDFDADFRFQFLWVEGSHGDNSKRWDGRCTLN